MLLTFVVASLVKKISNALLVAFVRLETDFLMRIDRSGNSMVFVLDIVN